MATFDGETAHAAAFGGERYLVPAVVAANERTVRDGFWRKMGRVIARVPFAREAAAAWFCAFDPATPVKVKGMLLAALAYFVMPVDLLPDFIAGLGFTDDLTVIATAIGLVRHHLRPEHYEKAEETLARLSRGAPAAPGP
jgi:uncharacterized membrane protein YkvA (DUF1232 family)